MTPTTTSSKPSYPHLDGIRGLAIALVVVFHVFVGKVSSGVDVFLFVGGLLLLSSQLRNAGDPEGMTFLQSVVRILRRLLPALITVVAATVAGVLVLFSRVEWGPLLSDASASLTYWVNWHLIGIEADYDSASSETSPFQHLWSMSVQLQIYLAIIAAVVLSRRLLNRDYDRQRSWRRTVTVVIATMTAASFVYATHLHASGQQPVNYYSTFSRFWEIGAGALLGLAVFSLRPSPRTRKVLAWAGLALIFSAGLFFDGVEQFPGAPALIPIAGALCLVAAGMGGAGRQESRPWAIRCLESPAAVGLGRLAYSLYLWHWPLLILAVQASGLQPNDPVVGLPVIAASLGLAWLTYTYVETPLRQKHKPQRVNLLSRDRVSSALAAAMPSRGAPRRARRTAVRQYSGGSGSGEAGEHGSGRGPAEARPPRPRAAMAVGLAGAFVLIALSPQVFAAATIAQQRAEEKRMEEALAEGRPDTYPGAAELLDGIAPREDVPVYPGLADRDPMMPPATADECTTEKDSTEIVFRKADGSPCQYGDTASDRTMYVVGGSHSEHWLGALEEIGESRGIRIVPFLRAGCPLYYGGEDVPGCFAWSEKVEDHIRASPPTEGVFMVSTRPSGDSVPSPEYVPDEYAEVFHRFAEDGMRVFAMRDNPWLRDEDGEQLDPRVCVTVDPSLDACTMSAQEAFAPGNPAEKVLDDERIEHLDLTDLLVKDQQVYPVIGNILVYRDWNHLTDQYVRTLTPELERQMFERGE